MGEFSTKLAAVYRHYDKLPNWVSFAVNDARHMYLNHNIMYKTTPYGSVTHQSPGSAAFLHILTGKPLAGRETPLASWLASFPVQVGSSVRSECMGIAPAANRGGKEETQSSGSIGHALDALGTMLRA